MNDYNSNEWLQFECYKSSYERDTVVRINCSVHLFTNNTNVIQMRILCRTDIRLGMQVFQRSSWPLLGHSSKIKLQFIFICRLDMVFFVRTLCLTHFIFGSWWPYPRLKGVEEYKRKTQMHLKGNEILQRVNRRCRNGSYPT